MRARLSCLLSPSLLDTHLVRRAAPVRKGEAAAAVPLTKAGRDRAQVRKQAGKKRVEKLQGRAY